MHDLGAFWTGSTLLGIYHVDSCDIYQVSKILHRMIQEGASILMYTALGVVALASCCHSARFSCLGARVLASVILKISR